MQLNHACEVKFLVIDFSVKCLGASTLATAMIGEGTDYANLAIKDELNAEEYGVAFRKGSDAADAVNAAFDELKADGSMQALADKYSLTLAD